MNLFLDRFFKLSQRNTNVATEFRGGCTTFLTVAYILAVNASIIADTGGTCSPADCSEEARSQAGDNCIFSNDKQYEECLGDVKSSLVTATALSSLIACLIMGFGANMPIALAPGMGMNAYFTYNVVGFRGTGNVKYETALAAIFLEGIIFVILAVFGLRAKIISYCPRSIMLASSAGIGLFLAHIGLQHGQGIGAVTFDPATLVTLGGCPYEKQANMFIIQDPSVESVCLVPGTEDLADKPNLVPVSPNYHCTGDRMEAPTMWLGIVGGLIMAFLLLKRVKGGIVFGILFVTIIAWIPGHGASYLGQDSAIPRGESRLHDFKKVASLPSFRKTTFELDFQGLGSKDVWVALITFLYVDFLDTTGTLFSMATHLSNYMPGFLSDSGEFPGSTMAFTTDGLATIVGSLLGTSPVTAYIESASGIREGARTGLASIVTGLWFLIAIFFSPLLKVIPPYATGPALIIVGALMMSNIAKINWSKLSDAIPAFLTLAVMPLTYSIAYGLIAGIVSWIILNGLDKITTKFGWVTPEDDGPDTLLSKT